jgi:hypothetical protein
VAAHRRSTLETAHSVCSSLSLFCSSSQ